MQIAPFLYQGDTGQAAALREAEAEAISLGGHLVTINADADSSSAVEGSGTTSTTPRTLPQATSSQSPSTNVMPTTSEVPFGSPDFQFV